MIYFLLKNKGRQTINSYFTASNIWLIVFVCPFKNIFADFVNTQQTIYVNSNTGDIIP